MWCDVRAGNALKEPSGVGEFGCEKPEYPTPEGTLMVENVGRRTAKINMVCDETNLTPNAGLAVVAETVAVLGLIDAFDSSIGPIKQRQRGLSGGQLVVSMAESLLVAARFCAIWTRYETTRRVHGWARCQTRRRPPLRGSSPAGSVRIIWPASRRVCHRHLAGRSG